MKNLQLLFIALCVGILSCTSDQKKEWKEYTDKEKLSYSMGMEYAIALQQQGMDSIIDLDFFHRAFEETFLFASETPGSLDSAALDIIREECQKVLNEYFETRQKNMVEKKLADNKKLIKESNGDEIILASGLKIIIIEDKDGLSPQLSDTVTTEILITDLDGKILQEFPEPQTFVLSQVFPGLTEGIQLMSVGDKWNLTIPPELANGSGEIVIFKVELLKIN